MHNGLRIHDILSVAVTLAVMALNVADLCIFFQIKRMHTVMFGGIYTTVMDSASCHNRDICTLTDIKIIVNGENIMNPQTIVHLKEGAHMEMETTQIKGIDSTVRVTKGDLAENASLEIHEKIMTHGKQYAKTDFHVDINGDNSSVNLVSRSVAKGESKQEFFSVMNGNAACAGHSECDAIIMDNACVTASPQLTANNIDANLIHEAAIGKIAGEQLIKLMTLGLTEKEAEEQIINGFLK